MKRVAVGLLLLLSACSPRSPEEFQKEGQALCEDLIGVLQTISSREELVEKEEVLKKKFQGFVGLMIDARKLQEELGEEADWEYQPALAWTSERLKAQLRRVYALEGGRELIERAQQEALVKLDAEERLHVKRRERISR